MRRSRIDWLVVGYGICCAVTAFGIALMTWGIVNLGG